MKVIVQRVEKASVTVKQTVISQINHGFLLLVGLHKNDNYKDIAYVANKIAKLRIFSDEKGLMNLNIHQVQGEILSISQFTLYGDTKKQNRPGFSDAMPYALAKDLYESFNKELINQGLNVKEGLFGEDMKVSLVNDGPVTIIIDTD